MAYQPGDILLEKYRIEELIGEGAFAQVYRVTHLGLNVPRAVKVLRRDTPGVGSSEYSDFRKRFRLEAQLGARLNTPTPHPNLLHIHDFQQVDDLLVLEMEYAPGDSLAERIEKAKESNQPIPVDEVVQMGVDVAQGLAAIHALDAVHRDLKPSNILFDAQGTAKVADLGLAQIPGGPSMRSKLSQAAPHPGTPGYMSPEQERTGHYLKSPSDVYALGLVLFETLTYRNYSNLKPGTRVQSIREDMPDWLDDLLVRMLANGIEERPWAGDEVAELLSKAQTEELGKQDEDQRIYEEKARLEEERVRQEAALHAAKIARLRKETETAIAAAQWGRAAQLLSQMEKLGEPGQLEANRLREAQVVARRKAEQDAKRKEKQSKVRIEGEELILVLAPGAEMSFVRIPAGGFLMGSDKSKETKAYNDETPQHQVHLDEYWIGKTPVTNRQYRAYLESTGNLAPIYWEGDRIPLNNEDHPVVKVSWYDANAFCKWAAQLSGKRIRLPTEAEWEKAARGTDGRIYPWGDQLPDSELCNFGKNIGDTTCVGHYSPTGDSPYGCTDMAGNVWEWTSSLYKDYPYRADDGREAQQAEGDRVLRGGSWYYFDSLVRAIARLRRSPDVTLDINGFRCARSP